MQKGDGFEIDGNLFAGSGTSISAWGTSSLKPNAYKPGETADLSDGVTLTVAADGGFLLSGPASFGDQRLPRVFTTASSPPEFTFDNYRKLLFDPKNIEGMSQGVLQHADGDHPGDDHPDPRRRLRRLCAGLDGFSRPGAADRRGRRRCWWCRCNWR